MEDGTRLAGYGSTAQEADEDLAQKVKEWDSIPSIGRNATLHEIAKAVWYPRLDSLKPLSRKKYEGVYIKHIRPALGHMSPQDIKPVHVQALVNKVAKGEKTGPTTAGYVRAIAAQILKCAMEYGLILQNPASFVRSPKKPEKRERVVTVAQAMDLLDVVDGTDLAAPVFLALFFGLRRGEIAGLKWEDLDRQTRGLRIVRQRQAIRPHGVVETPLKTTGSRRTLRLTPALIDELDRRGNLDSVYICTYRGLPWVPDTITEQWNKLRPEELSEWTFHDLRHGAAGLLASLGNDLMVVASILGHKHPTMSVLYTSVSEERRDKGMQAMGSLFGGE